MNPLEYSRYAQQLVAARPELRGWTNKRLNFRDVEVSVFQSPGT